MYSVVQESREGVGRSGGFTLGASFGEGEGSVVLFLYTGVRWSVNECCRRSRIFFLP